MNLTIYFDTDFKSYLPDWKGKENSYTVQLTTQVKTNTIYCLTLVSHWLQRKEIKGMGRGTYSSGMDEEKKSREEGWGEVSNGGKEMSIFSCDEVRKGVSKDILPSMFYESDHISSKHGRQLQKHIADQDLCVCVSV